MQNYREELEKNFTEKLQKLRDREKDTIEKCASKMKEIETANHEHRQKLLKDFEMLSLREEEIDKSRRLNEETAKVEKMKIDAMERELKQKIKDVDEQLLQM